MKKEEFIENYCKKSNISKEEVLKTQVILPCNCNYEYCDGWAVVTNNKMSIKAHNDLYNKEK